MSTCIFSIGSATQAIKAVRTLNSHSIPASTVKLGNSVKKGGCIYGIEFGCAYTDNIKHILNAENMQFEEY